MNNIHPTAIIDEGAQLGNHLSIGPYCRIGAEVKLGDGCHLGSHVVLDGPSTIGSENIFFPFSFIGGEPQDLKFNHEKTQLIVGSKNTFREGVSVHRGTSGGGGETIIGDGNLLM